MSKQKERLFKKKFKNELIEVWQKGNNRWLSINDIEQSRIDTKHPEKLVSTLNHYFLSCLLFIDTPKTILLGGLGGGSLVRFLHNRQPDIDGRAVEINHVIAQLAKDYFYFPENKWKIIIDDFLDYTANKNNLIDSDLILIDIGDGGLTPEWLTREEVLLKLKSQLSRYGVFAINLLVPDAASFSQTLATIRKVFNKRTLCISIPNHRNIIVFAFNERPKYSSLQNLLTRTNNMTEYWGINYSALLEQLQKENPKGSGIF